MTVARLIALGLAGLALGIGLWAVGLQLEFAFAVGILVIVLGVLWLCRSDADPLSWPERSDTKQAGLRDDVSRLAWSLRSQKTGVSGAATKRVRSLARTRLRRHGLDIDDTGDASRIVRLIGPSAHSILAPSNTGHVTRAQLDTVLEQLMALDEKEKHD